MYIYVCIRRYITQKYATVVACTAVFLDVRRAIATCDHILRRNDGDSLYTEEKNLDIPCSCIKMMHVNEQ